MCGLAQSHMWLCLPKEEWGVCLLSRAAIANVYTEEPREPSCKYHRYRRELRE
jgi:hypothetical protein